MVEIWKGGDKTTHWVRYMRALSRLEKEIETKGGFSPQQYQFIKADSTLQTIEDEMDKGRTSSMMTF